MQLANRLFQPVKIQLTYAEDRLAAVKLPTRPPADLTPDVLRHLDASLHQSPLQFPEASEFRLRVWKAIQQIPFGQTVTYQELAAQIGHPGAARAVGGACGANGLLLAVPCHRVVASRGLGGFALGLEWKRTLLALEATAAGATESASAPR